MGSDSAAASPPNASASPDWSTIDREILCPLCDYNLRGLIEPRCPECGHRFQWAEMLDDRSAVHPYLFEHHRERPIVSWWKTYFAGRNPLRFWRTLKPTHAVHSGRLIVYGAIVLAISIVLTVPVVGLTAAQVKFDNARFRARLLTSYTNMWANSADRPAFLRRFASPQAAVDSVAPPLSNLQCLGVVFAGGRWWGNEFSLPRTVILMLAWPLLTFLSVLVFRVSFRQAGIRRGHVARCVIYTSDTLLIGIAAVTGMGVLWLMGATNRFPMVRPMLELFGLAILLFFALVFVRLLLAVTLYLRIRGGVAMVIASQIIVWLATAKLALALQGY